MHQVNLNPHLLKRQEQVYISSTSVSILSLIYCFISSHKQLTASSPPSSKGYSDIISCNTDENWPRGLDLLYKTAIRFNSWQLLSLKLSTHLGGFPTQRLLLGRKSIAPVWSLIWSKYTSFDIKSGLLWAGRDSSTSARSSSGNCCNTDESTWLNDDGIRLSVSGSRAVTDPEVSGNPWIILFIYCFAKQMQILITKTLCRKRETQRERERESNINNHKPVHLLSQMTWSFQPEKCKWKINWKLIEHLTDIWLLISKTGTPSQLKCHARKYHFSSYKLAQMTQKCIDTIMMTMSNLIKYKHTLSQALEAIYGLCLSSVLQYL